MAKRSVIFPACCSKAAEKKCFNSQLLLNLENKQPDRSGSICVPQISTGVTNRNGQNFIDNSEISDIEKKSI